MARLRQPGFQLREIGQHHRSGEHLAYARDKRGKLRGEGRLPLCRSREMQKLLPDQIVEGGALPVSGLDRRRGVALLAPDLFEFRYDGGSPSAPSAGVQPIRGAFRPSTIHRASTSAAALTRS